MPPKGKQADAADAAAVTPPAPADTAVTMAAAAALNPAPAADKPAKPKPFMSEGMRHDLETVGWAVDPSSGARFELDRETGDVTVIERTSDV